MKTILLDFDYTLVDSSEGIVQCTRYGFEQMGLPVPEHADICKAIGHSLPDQFQLLAQTDCSQAAADFERHFKDEQARVMNDLTHLFEHTHEFIHNAKQLDCQLAIVSTKLSDTIKAFLQRHDLLDCFEIIIGELEVSDLKPDPEGLYLAMAAMRAHTDSTIMIGDSLFDAGAAASAGIGFIPVLTGKTTMDQFDAYPRLTIARNLRDALAYVEKSIKQGCL